MSQPRPARAHLAPRVALIVALSAAMLFALAAPASAITRKGAASKALTALGVRTGTSPVIVFGLNKPLRAGTRVTTKRPSRLVGKVGRERAFFFYQDSGPFRLYPHAGRVALVGAKSGKVKLSNAVTQPPLVNGKLPAFLKTSKGYRSSQYRVFSRLGITLAQPPKAEKQDVTVKQNRSKHITLTASASSADFITFTITNQPDHGTLSGQPPEVIYTPNAGYLGHDKFAFKANDATSQSNTAHVTIDVVPLGQPPVTTTSAGCTAYDARAAAVVVDGLAGVSDPDDTTLSSATVRISSGFQEGDDLLFTDQNGITGAYDDTTGVLTLAGDASVANYQAALRSVRYRNLSTGTPSAAKTVEFTANDGGTDSAAAAKQLCLTVGGGGANHKPIGETTAEGALLYTENDGPVPVDAGFIAVDPDSTTLSGATVKFIASQGSQDEEGIGGGGGGTVFNFFPAEDRLAFVDQNGITGNYNATTGELTLSGTASVADYQAAIQSVTYENTSENPTPDPRTIRFQLTDSGGASSIPSTRDVSVTPVNDAPVVTPSDGSTPYTEGDPLTTIDSVLTVGDVDNTTLQGGQVRISSGFQSGDQLAFVDQNGISGSYDTGTGVLTLTGGASVADYQTALQSIKYRGTSDNPSSSKTVEFVVNDGELDSAAATKDIAVTPVNDQPVLTTTGAALPFVEGSGPVAIDPGVTATDPDSTTLSGATVQITGNFSLSQDSLGFTDQNGISGFYDSETGILTLSGPASVAEYEAALRSVTYNNTSDNPSADTRTITFQANDGELSNNLSDPVTRDIEITPVNDAPLVTTTLGSTPYTQGDVTGVAVDNAVTAADVDDLNLESAQVRISSSGFQAGDELVFSDQAGISGNYHADTGILNLTGSASVEDYQTALQSITFRTTNATPSTPKTVEFVVNDGDADSNAATKSIDIGPPTG